MSLLMVGMLMPNLKTQAFDCDTSGSLWWCNYYDGGKKKKCEKSRQAGTDPTNRCKGNSDPLDEIPE